MQLYDRHGGGAINFNPDRKWVAEQLDLPDPDDLTKPPTAAPSPSASAAGVASYLGVAPAGVASYLGASASVAYAAAYRGVPLGFPVDKAAVEKFLQVASHCMTRLDE